MGCNNGCNNWRNNRCNSNLLCGLSNTLVKKLIAENCGEEDKQDSGCEATGDAPIIIKSCNTLNLGSIVVGPVGE